MPSGPVQSRYHLRAVRGRSGIDQRVGPPSSVLTHCPGPQGRPSTMVAQQQAARHAPLLNSALCAMGAVGAVGADGRGCRLGRRGHAPRPSSHSFQGGSDPTGRIWGQWQTRAGARRWPAHAPAGDGHDPEICRHSGDGPGLPAGARPGRVEVADSPADGDTSRPGTRPQGQLTSGRRGAAVTPALTASVVSGGPPGPPGRPGSPGLVLLAHLIEMSSQAASAAQNSPTRGG